MKPTNQSINQNKLEAGTLQTETQTHTLQQSKQPSCFSHSCNLQENSSKQCALIPLPLFITSLLIGCIQWANGCFSCKRWSSILRNEPVGWFMHAFARNTRDSDRSSTSLTNTKCHACDLSMNGADSESDDRDPSRCVNYRFQACNLHLLKLHCNYCI